MLPTSHQLALAIVQSQSYIIDHIIRTSPYEAYESELDASRLNFMATSAHALSLDLYDPYVNQQLTLLWLAALQIAEITDRLCPID